MRDDRQLDLFDNPPTAAPVAPAGALTLLVLPVTKRGRRSQSIRVPAVTAPVATFPQDRRHTKVQDVATKLLAKTTERAVEHYRGQVTEAMLGHLTSRHVSPDQHREQVRRFWVAVDCEVARRVNGRQRPTGGAA